MNRRLRIRLISFIAAVALLATGCATSAKRQIWLDGIQAKGVDEAVFQKIKRWRKIELTEIEQLAEKGVAKEDILRHLQESNAVYHLTTKDIDRLRTAGVETEIIDYLLSTPKLEESRLRLHQRSSYHDPFCPPHRRYSHPYWP